MYYYFHSTKKSAIFLSGAYLGTCGREPKKCNLSTNNALVEILSLENSSDDCRFILSKNTLNNPPERLSVVDLKGGFLLHVNSSQKKDGFKVLAQEKYHDAVVTVFCDNGLRVSIESENDFYATTIFENAISAEIRRLNDKRLILVGIQLNVGALLMIFSVKDKIENVYSKKVNSYVLEENLTASFAFNDIKKHVLTITLDYDGQKIYAKNTTLIHKKDIDGKKFIPELLPYLFLEDFLVGDNISSYLSPEILEKTNSLKEYLGNYLAIIPPPLFRDISDVGLVYKKSERIYYVDYFSFTIENGKIINLKKLDE